MNLLKHLPNLLTLTNLACGLAAVYSLMAGSMDVAIILFMISLLADVFDGMLARRLGVSGGIGVQLDSLADLISFCVLPATGLYKILAASDNYSELSLTALLPPCIMVASAAFRLARFNVDTRPREWFWGLATPAAAICVMGYVWYVYADLQHIWNAKLYDLFPILLCVAMAVAYQLNLRLPGLKSPPRGKVILVVLTLISIVSWFWVGSLVMTFGILLYLFVGILNLVIRIY